MTPQDFEAYIDQDEREAKRIQKGNLTRLMKVILRHPVPLFSGLGLIVIGTFATLLEPRLFGYAIDEAIIPKKWEILTRLALFFLFVICVRVASVIGQGYLFEVVGQRVTQDLRCRLFSHLQRLPISAHDKNPAGRLLTRVTNDVGSLSEMFSAGFVSIVGNALMVIGILVWLLVLDFKLGLIVAAVLPPLAVASIYFSQRLRIAYRDARSKLSALNSFLAENLLGMKVVHLFNRQRTHLSRFNTINQWYADAQISSVRVFALFQPTITFASGIAIALVIWFGGKATLAGTIKVGVLVAYFSYVLTFFQPLRELADKWNIFLSGMASAERVFAILDWDVELSYAQAREPAKGIANLRGEIVFENVWFAYEGSAGSERWVLKDFSFRIEPGMRVGVVGHTGAGKTTLISLLMRFYEPQRGRILIDGKDIREYDKRALRASIGIVQQDVFLFSGSLENNVTFWDEGGGEKRGQALAALQTMGVRQAAGEYQERGSNYSMGERQAVAFARALAADPKIWILDEATANMDSSSEALLERSLVRASQGRTALLIAHRLATVQSADLILVLHKGVLIEQGSHPSLIARNGLYARLYRYQKGQREVNPLSPGTQAHLG